MVLRSSAVSCTYFTLSRVCVSRLRKAEISPILCLSNRGPDRVLSLIRYELLHGWVRWQDANALVSPVSNVAGARNLRAKAEKKLRDWLNQMYLTRYCVSRAGESYSSLLICINLASSLFPSFADLVDCHRMSKHWRFGFDAACYAWSRSIGIIPLSVKYLLTPFRFTKRATRCHQRQRLRSVPTTWFQSFQNWNN